jgi:hypothetical protein
MGSLSAYETDDKQRSPAATLMQHALDWAARGFKVIPLRVGKKLPAHEKWQDKATSDPATIRTWWEDGKPRNYGVVADGLLIVDLDTKSGKPGLETWQAIGGRFDTLCVRTPSGGFHLYYASHETANSAGKLGPGIDTRGHRASFVVGPGSVVEGGVYTVHDDKPIAPAPEHILNRLALPRQRAENGAQPLVELDLPAAIEHARRYLAEAPEAVEGASGDQTTYDVACAVRDLGISEPVAVELMLEHWNDRCAPPWEAEALEAKVGNAYAYAQNRPGQKLLEIEPSLWFDVLPAANENGAESVAAAPAIKWLRPGEWEGKAPEPRQWVVENWIPAGEVTLLYGDGGIGKTLLIHQYATCAAAGIDWLGQPTRKARVMCFFCEDSEEELHRRQIDINRHLGLTMADTDENLRIVSRKNEDNQLVLWDRNTGALKRQPIWDQLLRDAVEFRADVVIIDTIADTYSGSEIDRGQVNAFVKSCLGKLAKGIGGSVIALGHPSMAGLSSGSGTSGSTAWNNAVRSRLYLRYPKDVTRGDIRELEGMKLNYGARGSLLKLQWKAGAFGVLAGVVTGAAKGAFPQLDDAAERAVLAAAAVCAGRAVDMKERSQNYAPRVLKRYGGEAVEAMTAPELEGALLRLEARGVISFGEVGRKENRHPIVGIIVHEDRMSPESGNVFD